MGGRGSGRRRGGRKTAVEECLFLDINLIRRYGPKRKSHIPVFVKSTKAPWYKQVALIDLSLDESNEDSPVFIIKYDVAIERGKKKIIEPVPLQATRPYFGCDRWWFTCPLDVGGKACFQRVGKLYLPPGAVYFGCRHCYELSYRSCQEIHKRDWLSSFMASSTPEVTYIQAKRTLADWWSHIALANTPLLGVQGKQGF